jgi:hypothetical protein
MSETNQAPTQATRPRRPERDYTSAVYGSVLAASVIVSAGDARSPVALAILIVVSGFVFWIAHVYAATVASVHGGWHVAAIRTGMRHEWPVAAAAIPPAIAALVCGWVPDISTANGSWAALAVAIAEQQLWGWAAVRRANVSGRVLARTVALNLFMGFVIVALKLALPGH